MKTIIFCAIVVGFVWWYKSDIAKEKAKSYPYSSASYEEVDQQVGCASKYSDDKKNDIFDSQYKYKALTWRGEVVSAEADKALLDINENGMSDLSVDFAGKNAAYNLKTGDIISVTFVLKSAGGCFLPFAGFNARIN